MATLKTANSARPSALPQQGETVDYAKLAQDFQEAPAAQNQAAGEDLAKSAAQFGGPQAEGTTPAPQEGPGLGQQALDMGSKALDVAGRGLDYLGGISRAADITATDLMMMKHDPSHKFTVTGEDLGNIVKGKGPNTAEYLKRLGVPEGGSLTLPLVGKVTVRGAEGLVGDIMSDPLTSVAKTVREIPYLKTLLNGPGSASQAVGEAIYKSALPEKARAAGDAIIEGVKAAPEFGVAGVKGAPIGSTATIAEKVNDMSRAMGGIRQGLYDKATQLGATINMAEAPLTRTEAVLARLKRNPNLAPLAQNFEEMVSNFRNAGQAPLDLVSEWKTGLYDTLPAGAFDAGGNKLKGVAKQFKAALALDFKDLIVKTGDAGEKGLGQAIDQINSKWGTLLEAIKPLDKAAAGGGKLGHMIDGAVLAVGGVKAEAIKKGYDLATSPFMKTLAGNALMSAGKNGLATGYMNRLLINKANEASQQQVPMAPSAPAMPVDNSGEGQ